MLRAGDEPIVVSQEYAANSAEVWDAITNAGRMREWYFAVLSDFRPEVGFETEFTIENEGRIFPHRWKITEVVPQKKISYNWEFDGYEGKGGVTFELTESNGRTLLTLTNFILESFPEDVPEFTRESCIAGWEYFIQGNLKEYLESK